MNKGKVMNIKELNKQIGERIVALRKERGITMEKLAYESGISKGGLSEIERGMKDTRISTIFRICNTLEMSVKEFYDFEFKRVFD